MPTNCFHRFPDKFRLTETLLSGHVTAARVITRLSFIKTSSLPSCLILNLKKTLSVICQIFKNNSSKPLTPKEMKSDEFRLDFTSQRFHLSQRHHQWQQHVRPPERQHPPRDRWPVQQQTSKQTNNGAKTNMGSDAVGKSAHHSGLRVDTLTTCATPLPAYLQLAFTCACQEGYFRESFSN